MAITKTEIVSLAFTRNVSEDHITNSDIVVAVDMYVDAYVSDVTDLSTIYSAYVKPVIAYGVAFNIFDRIASEITDRGVVQMVSEGATVISDQAKLAMKKEYSATLNILIKKMIEAADDEGMDIVDRTMLDDDNGFDMIGFTGATKMGIL